MEVFFSMSRARCNDIAKGALLLKAMDDGKGWAHDDENGNFEGLSSYAHLVSYYKVIEDYDKNDFWGPLSSMALNNSKISLNIVF